jgi:hypothetical protein
MAKQIYTLKQITSSNKYEIRFLLILKCDLKLWQYIFIQHCAKNETVSLYCMQMTILTYIFIIRLYLNGLHEGNQKYE